MEKKYYAVKQRLHPSEPSHNGLAFVVVEDGEIKRMDGDTFIPSLLRLGGEELKISDKADCEYDIIPMNESQLDLAVLGYQESIRAENADRHALRRI